MISSTKTSRGQSLAGRLIASLMIGLMLLALGATTAFAGTSGTACKVTYGGRITAANGDKATFGGNANAAGPSGQEQFRDHVAGRAGERPPRIAVSAVTCAPDGTSATILGTATVNGVGPVGFQIERDGPRPALADPIRTSILLSTGYDTGVQLDQGRSPCIDPSRHSGRRPAPRTGCANGNAVGRQGTSC